MIPQPDGILNTWRGIQSFPTRDWIHFPLLETFGRDLDTKLLRGKPQSMKEYYVLLSMYDTIKDVEQTYAHVGL